MIPLMQHKMNNMESSSQATGRQALIKTGLSAAVMRGECGPLRRRLADVVQRGTAASAGKTLRSDARCLCCCSTHQWHPLQVMLSALQVELLPGDDMRHFDRLPPPVCLLLPLPSC